jgi:hypothetical protein
MCVANVLGTVLLNVLKFMANVQAKLNAAGIGNIDIRYVVMRIWRCLDRQYGDVWTDKRKWLGPKWNRNKEAKKRKYKETTRDKKEAKSEDTERNTSHLDYEKLKTKDSWVTHKEEKKKDKCVRRRG